MSIEPTEPNNNIPLILDPSDVFWWEQEGWDHEANQANADPLPPHLYHG